MRLIALIALTAAAGLAACAPVSSTGSEGYGGSDGGQARACFLPRTLANFRSEGESVLYIRAGRNEVYELRASGFCGGLSSARSMVITNRTGSGATACVGDFVDVVLAGPGLQDHNGGRCRAQVSRRLTDEDLAVLTPRLRP